MRTSALRKGAEMPGVDNEGTSGVKVCASDASPRIAHNATVRKDSHGPFRAVMTGVRYQPLRDERGLRVLGRIGTDYHAENVSPSVCLKLTEGGE